MKRSLVALALVSWGASAATPTLSGLYAVGEMGLVDFSMSEGKIVGKLRSSAQCVFAADTQVVTGNFEGNVFVGTVTLCLDGAGCPGQRAFPMLGVHHGDAVAAWIHLDEGCTSPALDGKALFFRPATVEEKQKVVGDSSAAAVAQKQNKADPQEQATEACQEGDRLLQDRKVNQAREKFRQAMEADPNRWEALMGFGVTEVKLGRSERALEYFDRAFAIGSTQTQPRRPSPGHLSQVHYNRACALMMMGDKKGAVASLRAAVKLGGAALYSEPLLTDDDLEPLRTDPEFKRFVNEVTRKKQR